MLPFVILFVAAIAVICPLNYVESAPPQLLDINKILELVQQYQLNTRTNKQNILQLRDVSDSDSDSDETTIEIDDSDDTDYSSYEKQEKIRKEKIIDMIAAVVNEKNNRLRNNDRVTTNNKGKANYNQDRYVNSDKYDKTQANNNIQAQILEKIFAQGFRNKEHQAELRDDNSNLLKNNLLNSLTLDKVSNYNKNDNAIASLDDYSKVYIVLNPQAARNSANKNTLNELISKAISLTSQPLKKERAAKRKPRRYKGFVLNEDQLKRQYRQSKDSSVLKDSYDQNAVNPSIGLSGPLTIL